MTFASCLCREIMKLGKIKSDKAIMKDLMKCLAAIAPTTWLSASMVSPYSEASKHMMDNCMEIALDFPSR